MKKLLQLTLACCLLLPASFLPAQEGSSGSIFNFLLEQDSIPSLKIDTNWGRLLRTKMAETYQDARFSYYGADGQQVDLDVKLKTRGNIRKEVCTYPPVKIKIPKRDLREQGFNSLNEIKFVFPCGNSKKDLDYLFREALIYKLYEQIHPICVRTRLVKMEAVRDSKQRFNSYALLLEHEEEIQSRLHCEMVNRGIIVSTVLDRDTYLKMVFFEYMISNTDWSVPNRHNLLLLQVPDFSERVLPVPYDFDYSGLVNTHYAVPAAIFPIKSVTERYFMGRDVTKEEALRTARFFIEKKDALLQCVTGYPVLEKRSREEVMESLEEFFNILQDENQVLKTFVTAPEK